MMEAYPNIHLPNNVPAFMYSSLPVTNEKKKKTKQTPEHERLFTQDCQKPMKLCCHINYIPWDISLSTKIYWTVVKA